MNDTDLAGFKSLTWSDGKIYSPLHGSLWVRGSLMYHCSTNVRPHSLEDCGGGIYAAWDFGRAKSYGISFAWQKKLMALIRPSVGARVAIGTYGWKCTKAEIVAIVGWRSRRVARQYPSLELEEAKEIVAASRECYLHSAPMERPSEYSGLIATTAR